MTENLRWKDYPVGQLRGDEKAEYALTEQFLYIRIPFKAVLPDVEVVLKQLPTPLMSRRETEVYRGVTEAKSNKEIARDLNLSERTIKFHVSSVLRKYGVDNRAALIRMSQTQGLRMSSGMWQ